MASSCCKRDDLKEPLNGDSEEKEIDISKLIDQSVKIRLPRLALSGQIAPPPRPPTDPEEDKKAKDAPKLTVCQKICAAVMLPIRAAILLVKGTVQMILALVLGFLALVCPPSVFLAACKKYEADLALNGLYLGVPLYLTEKDGETFALYFGLLSSILILMKNVGTIMGVIFGVIDKIQEVLDNAIDTLKGELGDVISEKVANPVVAKVIADKLRGGIDAAKKEIVVTKYLPCLMRKRCYFLTVVGLPLAGYLVYSTLNTTPAAPATPGEDEPDLLIVQLAQAVAEKHSWFSLPGWLTLPDIQLSELQQKQLKTVATNVFFAFIASTPVIMSGMNSGMASVEKKINGFLQGTVAEKIDAPGVQHEIDRMNSGTGGLCCVQ